MPPIKRLIVATGAFVITPSILLAQDVGCRPAVIEFHFATDEGSEGAIAFRKSFPTAIQSVCEWWGSTYTGHFKVKVSDDFAESRALVPAWNGKLGEMFFPESVAVNGRAATVHEVTHVFAPNANRFLAEGLAVYAHEFLKGGRAFPNFGVDLHKAAGPFAADAAIGVFDKVATPAPLRVVAKRLQEREIYIVAGSFVRFLISEFGLEKFRELYALTPLIAGVRNAGNPNRWEKVYGHSIEQLAASWRSHLGIQ